MAQLCGLRSWHHQLLLPRTLHRNIVADLGITTPKQLARTLVRFSKRHPNFESSSFAIPQVPGSIARSTTVYGGLEPFLKSKKYLFPLAVFHPIVTGGIAVAYLGTGRFDPAREALAPDSSNKLRPTNGSAKRPTYEDQLNSFMAHLNIVSPSKVPPPSETVKGKMWSRLQAGAEPGLDSSH